MKLIKEDITLTEAPSLRNIAGKVGGAIKSGAQKVKDATINYKNKVHDKNIAERGYKQSDLDKLSTEEIVNQIDTKEGYTENNKQLIDEYIDRLAEEVGDTAGVSQEAKSVIGESISTLGLNDNPFLTFTKNYMKSGAPQLTGEMASTVYTMWANDKLPENVIENQNSYLYDEKVYSGDDNENLYKLKSLVFVDNPNNTKKYGLYRKDINGNRTNNLIGTQDIIGMSARDIEKFLNNSQSRNRDGTNAKSFGDYIGKNNLTPQTAYSHFYNLLKQRYKGSALSNRASTLKQVLTNNTLSNDFRKYEIIGDSANDIITSLNNYILDFRKAHRGHNKPANQNQQVSVTNNYYGRGRSGSRKSQLNRISQEAVDSLVTQFGEANRARLISLAKKYYKKGITLDELQTQMVQNFNEDTSQHTNTRGANTR